MCVCVVCVGRWRRRSDRCSRPSRTRRGHVTYCMLRTSLTQTTHPSVETWPRSRATFTSESRTFLHISVALIYSVYYRHCLFIICVAFCSSFSKTGLVSSTWERQYFFTQGGNLMQQARGEVAGSLVTDLDNCSVMAVDCDDRRFCFQVTSFDGKKWVLLLAFST